MKKSSLFLSIVFLLPLHTAAKDRHVSVFYYPWYDVNRHWGEGYLRHLLNPRQEPLLSRYSNRDDEVLEQHRQWSVEYGIDNWICSWWGPNSWENETIDDYISPILQGSNVTYCLFYESAGLLNMQNGRIEFNDQRTSTLRNHFKFIAGRFFDDPAYYRIDGRPVVYIYLTRTFVGDYENALSLVRQDLADMGYDLFLIGDEVYWGAPDLKRIASLDGITAYNMHGPHEYNGYPYTTHFIERVEERYAAYQNAAQIARTVFIPKIMPGFNDRGVRLNADHYVIPNQVHPDSGYTSTFEHYAAMAEQFIDSTVNALCITSFNEWHEDTQIEPTVVAEATNQDISSDQRYTKGYSYTGYGTAYLQVIRDMFSDASSGVEKEASVPVRFDSIVNYPNPFNEATVVKFELSRPDNIELLIYSIDGRRVKKYILREQNAGRHFFTIQMRDLPSGVYFYALAGDDFCTSFRKMAFVK